VAADYSARGVGVVAISSNSVETHPQDGPDAMAGDARELGEEERRLARTVLLAAPCTLTSLRNPHPPTAGYPFPYLYDATQDVARAYKVACTPEFFVFDADLGLAYHGQFDDARPKNGVAPTGRGWGRGLGLRGAEHGAPHHAPPPCCVGSG
jgi:hypothetical protein